MSSSPHVLVVEDDRPTREALTDALDDDGFDVTAVADGEAAIIALGQGSFAAIVTDLMMGEVGGLEVLARARKVAPEAVVIVVTGFGTVDSAVQAVRAGAWDYLTKPVDLDRLGLSLRRGLGRRKLVQENQDLKRRLRDRFGAGNIIGRSPLLLSVLDNVERIAATDANVLITGESGVGKELIVEAIHHGSPRVDRPLVRVNAPALAEGVFESELFGHEKGAFTGAVRSREGRFEAANGGTLFLDEIGELSQGTQAKLLRVLESRTIERVGSSQSVSVDVRVVAATNRDLSTEVAAGRFREDLFYRLAVLTVEMPPLRDRPEDIPLLVEHFVRQLNARHGREVAHVTTDAMDALVGHRWPGNVRELHNCLESAVVLCRSDVLGVSDLPSHLGGGGARRIVLQVGTSLEDAERVLFQATLDSHGGNKARAARTLGIGLRTLYRRLDAWAEEG